MTAKSFADRLPPVVAREEPDIAHLSDAMADILYPGRRPRRCRIDVAFRAFGGPNYERAVGLARRSAAYSETAGEAGIVHHGAFDTSAATRLRELFELVGAHPGTEVRVDGRKVPYATELWLPLFWLFVRSEE
jgi:hypothetical protein